MANGFDWGGLYKNVQQLIASALEQYRPFLTRSQGELPPGSLPVGGPGGTGYPPTPATTTVTGGVQLTGALSGTATDPIVVAVQQIPYSGTPPTIGQVYAWNGTAMVPTTPTVTPTDVLGTVIAADAYHSTKTLHQHIDTLYSIAAILLAGTGDGYGTAYGTGYGYD